ncbi:prophage LambdaSo, holin, putative [Roseobacter sp. SK209-2-6]|uniref:HNH endonuclease n=1 Tax=Roseobacter sp. SK209-2-6 TaxID=388739 RepID=UPI0000F3C5DA|nr:hypothetical protein [Roseobacter sp. SK209-2-6]EBA18388.1 prophage LambdaSo, holin, putative [Roseobacter sp. SK209-2-6]
MQLRKQFPNSGLIEVWRRSERWKQFRLTILKRDLWACKMCGRALVTGRKPKASAVVDHLIPAHLRPDLFFEAENNRSVCKGCHDGPCQSIEAKHGRDEEAIKAAKMSWHPGGYDAQGFPLDPSHPWNS